MLKSTTFFFTTPKMTIQRLKNFFQMHFFKKANMSFTQACLDVSIILQSGRELILQTLLLEQ